MPSCRPSPWALSATRSSRRFARHREAWRAFDADCIRTDNVVAEQEGREVTEADEAAWSAANQFEEDAFDALVTLPPVTVAGMRAAIEYFAEFESDCIPGSTEKFLSALLKSPLLAVWPLALKHDGRRFTLAAVLF